MNLTNKKYIISVNMIPFVREDGSEIYISSDGMHFFYKDELDDLEEIKETPEEIYKRGYNDGIKSKLVINQKEDVEKILDAANEINRIAFNFNMMLKN